MMNFSYTLAPSLKKELENAEKTRNQILLELIPPKEELELRWEELLEKIRDAKRISGQNLKKHQISDNISLFQGSKKNTDKEIVAYKKAYDFIRQNWKLNESIVASTDIKNLYSFFKNGHEFDEKILKQTIDFIQVNPEHPIVQSALALILILPLLPQNDQAIPLSILLASLFLYKNGFDFREMLSIEEFVANDIEHFKNLIKTAQTDKNLSSYLEYFGQNVALQAERALKKLEKRPIEKTLPNYFYELTERQKEILTLLDKPSVKITNKTVQKYFGVSQITASRDLAKLNTLGLIFSAGKGRSVYYTKI